MSGSGQKCICPVCSAESGSYVVPVNEYGIYKCPQCGLEYTSPMPSAAQLAAFYSTYTDVRAPSDVVMRNALRNIKLLNGLGYCEQQAVLDFGTGAADFVDVAGENCFGVDFNGVNKARCYKNLDDLPVKQFDFITLWGVLEHLADPVAVLEELKNYLRPDGMLVMTTVDAEGVIPYYYKPVEHLTYWTRNATEIVLGKIGVELVEYKPYKMVQRAEVYVDRLLSRTPVEYRAAFDVTISALPEYVEIPTNEVLIVGKSRI